MRNIGLIGLTVAVSLIAFAPDSKADVIYAVNLVFPHNPATSDPDYTAIGSIVTNGHFGALLASDIMSWSFQLSDGANTTSFASSSGAGVTYGFGLDGGALTADANGLYFDFSQNAELEFYANNSLATPYLCFGGINVTCGGVIQVSLGRFLIKTGKVQIATTAVSAVPLPAALPLFAGGLGVMAWLGRRRKRTAAAGA